MYIVTLHLIYIIHITYCTIMCYCLNPFAKDNTQLFRRHNFTYNLVDINFYNIFSEITGFGVNIYVAVTHLC